MQRPTLMERAFELAASGEYATITLLKGALRQEGYDAVEPQMAGKAIRTQLRRAIAGAKSEPAASGGEA